MKFTNEKIKKPLIFLSLFIIFLLSILVRASVCHNSKGQGFVPFISSSAFYYYFAGKIALGEKIPRIDYNIQYPEGLEVFKKTSIFMEYVVGYLYRFLFSKIPFHDFVRHFVRICGAIPIFIVYLIATRVMGNSLSGLISAAFYAVIPAAMNRTVGLVFIRENFALPIIFLQVWFLVKFFGSGKTRDAIFSGFFLMIALACWQLTQFYYFLLTIYFGLNLFFKDDGRLYKSLNILILFSILGGLAIPYLRANHFLISYPMLISYAISITYLFKKKTQTSVAKTSVVFALLLVSLSLALFTFSKDIEVYSHVYSLMFSKIRFLGRLPLNPQSLSFETRILWDSSMSLLSVKDFISNFSLLTVFGLFPIILTARDFVRGKTNKSSQLILYFLASFFLLSLLIKRLIAFSIFFLSIYAGGIILLSRRRLARILILSLTSTVLLLQTVKMAGSAMTFPQTVYIVDLLNWVMNNTESTDVILSSPRTSPEILAYTGRPILLHQKLESKEMREKIRRWAEAIFAEGEGDLYRLCQEWNVSWLVSPVGTYLNTGPASWRYITDNLELNKKSIGYKLDLPRELKESEVEWRGEKHRVITGTIPKPKLTHFDLVYWNKYFNVYKVY